MSTVTIVELYYSYTIDLSTVTIIISACFAVKSTVNVPRYHP